MNSIDAYDNRLGRGGIRISTLVATITFLFFVVVLVVQLTSKVEPLPLLSLVFLIFSMVTLSGLLFAGARSENGIGIFFYILFLIYYGFSYINLMYFEGGFHRGEPTLIDNLEESVFTSYFLLFFTVSLVVASILFIKGNKNVNKPNKPTVFLLKNPISAIRAAIFLSLISIIAHHFSFVLLGVGRYAGWVDGTAFFRFIYFILIDKDIYFILTMGLAIASWEILRKYDKALFIGLVFIYILQALIFGSKAGVFWTVIYCIGLLLFIRGDVKIKYTLLLTIGAFLFFILPISYGIGMVFRSIQNVSEFTGASITISEVFNHAFSVLESRGEKIFDIDSMFRSIFGRINAFDSFVVILDYGFSHDMYSHIVGGIVNTLLPGVYFENSLTATRLYSVIYLGSTLPEALEHYHTEIYYIFGAFVPYFGIIIGLILSVIFITFLFSVYYQLRVISSLRKIYYMAFFMYFFTWSFVYMGIEELLYMMVAGILHLFIFIFFVEIRSNKKRVKNFFYSAIF